MKVSEDQGHGLLRVTVVELVTPHILVFGLCSRWPGFNSWLGWDFLRSELRIKLYIKKNSSYILKKVLTIDQLALYKQVLNLGSENLINTQSHRNVVICIKIVPFFTAHEENLHYALYWFWMNLDFLVILSQESWFYKRYSSLAWPLWVKSWAQYLRNWN